MRKKTLVAIITFLLVIILITGGLVMHFLDRIKNEDIYPRININTDSVYLVNRNNISTSEYIMLTSLQGIVAKDKAQIYLYSNNLFGTIIDFLEENPSIKRYHIVNPWELVDIFREHINDNGCVIFDRGNNPTVNMAATISGIDRYLMVASDNIDKLKDNNLVIARDLTLRDNENAYIATQESIFNEYKDRLNPNVILHQPPNLSTTRDYTIALGALCMYVSESDLNNLAFRAEVFEWAEAGSPVLGWSDDELMYVQTVSEYGLYVIPSDHSSNLTYLAAMYDGKSIKYDYKTETVTLDESKHYVALVLSDGDNIQWYQNSFNYGNSIFNNRKNDTSFKMSFTAPPAMAELSPFILKTVYKEASVNDSFICGVSGIGYINPSSYPEEYLPMFVDNTVKAMKKADMSIVAILDNIPAHQSPNLWATSKLLPTLAYYSEKREIDGGLLQIGNYYEQLKGKILWSDNKPFISARHSMWFSDGGPTSQELDVFVKKINDLKPSIHTHNGYSYINIHPWSTSYQDIEYLVANLSDHIQLVTAEELIYLAKHNITDKTN